MGLDIQEWVFSYAMGRWVCNLVVDLLTVTPEQVWSLAIEEVFRREGREVEVVLDLLPMPPDFRTRWRQHTNPCAHPSHTSTAAQRPGPCACLPVCAAWQCPHVCPRIGQPVPPSACVPLSHAHACTATSPRNRQAHAPRKVNPSAHTHI